MNKNSEIYQSLKSFQVIKEGDKSDTMFRDVKENIISTDNVNCSSSLNNEDSESSSISSVGSADPEYKKMLTLKHQNPDSVHQFQTPPKEDFQTIINVTCECKFNEDGQYIRENGKRLGRISENKSVISKNLETEKDMLTEKLEYLSFDLDEMKKKPIFEADLKENEDTMKRRYDLKDIVSANEISKKSIPVEFNPLIEFPFKMESGESTEIDILVNIKEIAEEPNNKVNEENELLKMPNEDSASNYFDITTPQIGNAVISKNLEYDQSDIMNKELEDFSLYSSGIKKETITNLKNDEDMKKRFDLKDVGTINGDLKEDIPVECNHFKELPIKMSSGKEVEKDFLINIQEISEESNKNSILTEKNASEENESPRLPNEDVAFSNYSEITVPRIGNHIFQNEEGPFTECYDLAVERNERRFNCMKQTGIDDEILKLVDEEENMSENDKKLNNIRKQQENIKKACYVTKLCSKILKELLNGNTDERKIIHYLMQFLYANVTPTGLLYVPHLVHTISFIRGNKAFSKELRLAADECYNYCHAMFPIPPGYNFETVYTYEMRKFLPDSFDKMEGSPLDYGNIDDILENSDSDGDDNDGINDMFENSDGDDDNGGINDVFENSDGDDDNDGIIDVLENSDGDDDDDFQDEILVNSDSDDGGDNQDYVRGF